MSEQNRGLRPLLRDISIGYFIYLERDISKDYNPTYKHY